MTWRRDDRERERVPLGIGRQQRHLRGHILVDEDPLVLGFRRLVGARHDPDGHRRGIAVRHAVVGDERERIHAGEARVGRVDQVWRRPGETAVRHIGGHSVSQRLAVGVRCRQRDRDGRVEVGGNRLIRRGWRVVHRGDRDRDGRQSRLRPTVAGLVGEAVAPLEAGICQRAVRRRIHDDRCQGIVVDVGVVDQHARCGDGQRRLFAGAVAVVGRHRRVVDRHHRHADRARRRAAVTIYDRIGERVGAVVVRRWGIRHRAIGIDRRGAVSGCADRADRQTVTVHIGVIRAHGNRHGRIFVCGRGVCDCDGCVVDRGDHDGHGRGVGVVCPVGDLVGEAVGAVDVRLRRVGEAAVRVERERAVCRAAHQSSRQRSAFDVGVVAQHAWRRDDERLVFGGGVRVGERHRRVVHGIDRDRHGRDIRVGRSVVRCVRKAVAAVRVRGRRITEAPVRIQRHSAVRRIPDQMRSQRRAAVGVGVVGQHVAGDGGVFICDYRVVDGDRWIVHSGHGHDDGAGGSATVAVADGVGRCVRDRAVGIDRHAAVLWRADAGHRQGIAVHVDVIAEHRDRDRRVFRRRRRIGIRDRCVVHRRHGDRHRRRVGVETPVVRFEREAVGAVVIRGQRVDQRRRRAAQRPVRRAADDRVRER